MISHTHASHSTPTMTPSPNIKKSTPIDNILSVLRKNRGADHTSLEGLKERLVQLLDLKKMREKSPSVNQNIYQKSIGIFSFLRSKL